MTLLVALIRNMAGWLGAARYARRCEPAEQRGEAATAATLDSAHNPSSHSGWDAAEHQLHGSGSGTLFASPSSSSSPPRSNSLRHAATAMSSSSQLSPTPATGVAGSEQQQHAVGSRRNSTSNPSSSTFVASPNPASISSAAAAIPILGVCAPSGPNARFIGAIDQGTSSTRFILFDHEGCIVRSAQVEIEQIHPESGADGEGVGQAQAQSGWTEHDPLEIMRSIHACVAAVLEANPPIRPEQIVALGLTNQRETSVVWDARTGRPLHNAIVWHDARTASVVDEMEARLSESGGKDHFRSSCGLPLSTYFSATKIKWMLDHVPEVQIAVAQGLARAGTIDSWIIWNLTGGDMASLASSSSSSSFSPARPVPAPVHVTDVTNASRTMLMDLQTLRWHEGNCREFGIPMCMLPQIRSSSEVYGHVFDGPLKGVPIAGVSCVARQASKRAGERESEGNSRAFLRCWARELPAVAAELESIAAVADSVVLLFVLLLFFSSVWVINKLRCSVSCVCVPARPRTRMEPAVSCC